MTTLEKVAAYLSGAGITTFCVNVGIDNGTLQRDPAQPPAFPRQIEEVEEAVAWVEAHASTYNGSTSMGVSLVGGSAGAHIAVYTGMRMNKTTPGRVRTVVGLSGPYDLPKIVAGGPPKLFTSVSQATNVTQKQLEEYAAGTLAEPLKGEVKTFLEKWSVSFVIDKTTNPKFYLAHSETDGVVFVNQTTDFYAALVAAGCTVTKAVTPSGGHGFGENAGKVGSESVEQAYTTFIKTA